jgi:hypothetical protein
MCREVRVLCDAYGEVAMTYEMVLTGMSATMVATVGLIAELSVGSVVLIYLAGALTVVALIAIWRAEGR